MAVIGRADGAHPTAGSLILWPAEWMVLVKKTWIPGCAGHDGVGRLPCISVGGGDEVGKTCIGVGLRINEFGKTVLGGGFGGSL
jgi:hypothetical protein